jgi:hypothetical protein
VATRCAAVEVVKGMRCVSRLTDAAGNRKYVARRKEFTPQVQASLQERAAADEGYASHLEAVLDRAIGSLPEPDRRLYRTYMLNPARGKFLLDHGSSLSELGIDTVHKLSHWVKGVRARLRDTVGRFLANEL